MTQTFEAGQIWRYRTRAGEEQSRAYIARVDTLPDGAPAFHLRLDGVRIATPCLEDGSGVQTELPHVPVSLQTLQTSLTELQASQQPMPDISEGWQQWKDAQGGIFTITLAEILDTVEQTLRDAAH